jgi:hypothetical protein
MNTQSTRVKAAEVLDSGQVGADRLCNCAIFNDRISLCKHGPTPHKKLPLNRSHGNGNMGSCLCQISHLCRCRKPLKSLA